MSAQPEPGWADVLALVEQLDASGLADAEIVVPGLSVRVSRTVLDGPVAAPVAATPVAAPAPAPAAVVPPAPTAPAAHDGPVVTAPMLGVLFGPDTTVAIIEVMKLMNPVTAGAAGVVVEVCVADAATVEHGDVLFRLRADG